MFVQTEITPNPNALKFLPGKKVSNEGSFEITKKEEIDNDLVRNLLSINGVTGVFLGADFLSINKDKYMVYLSSYAEKSYYSIDYKDDMFLVFGKESVGLSKDIITKNSDKLYKIPIHSSHVRSLNLANAVSIVVYEGLRNI